MLNPPPKPPLKKYDNSSAGYGCVPRRVRRGVFTRCTTGSVSSFTGEEAMDTESSRKAAAIGDADGAGPDRVIQMAAKLVMEPIFEADFQPCSYGFRPQKSPTLALEAIRERATGATVLSWMRTCPWLSSMAAGVMAWRVSALYFQNRRRPRLGSGGGRPNLTNIRS
jgi:hypothetical protein